MFYIWITIRCYFASLITDIFVFLTRYSLSFVSDIIYFIHQIVMVQSVCIRFRSEIICSSYRITAIVLWAKPFGCEKLNKRDFKLLSRCFFHLCFSLESLQGFEMCSHINSRDLPKPVGRTATISLSFSKYSKHLTWSGFKQNDRKLQRLKAYPSWLNTDSFSAILILPLLNMQTSLIYYILDFEISILYSIPLDA